MAEPAVEEFFKLYGMVLLAALVLATAIFLTPVALLAGAGYIGYRLYKESPWRAERLARRETMALYAQALQGTVNQTEADIEAELSRQLPPETPAVLRFQLVEIGKRLFEEEGLTPDIPPPPALCNTVEAARYRDLLARAGQARVDRRMSLSALAMIAESLAVIARQVPRMEGEVLVPVTQFFDRPGEAVSAVIAPFFGKNPYNHFKALRQRLEANLAPRHRTSPIFPEEYKGTDVADAYLRGTPLSELFELKAPFAIPEPLRFEHTHMIGGSGHGKTQTLQFLIARDLADVASGEKSVIVIDSQGDLIRNILAARAVDPNRVVLIDPEDIAYPVCLNLFSVGQERLQGYAPLERERLANSIIELYDFVLGSLLSAGMTSKQSVVFRYVTRLMFHIPDATIHTLRELMEPGGEKTYEAEIARLEGTARRFFETEFAGKEFIQTRQQVLRRLYQVLENPTFERMFSHPRSKLDLFAEMNAGKLILINTAKSLLKESGTEIFGRFFIALIAQAAQERATMPEWERMPTLVYVDEAQDYFDRNVGTILAQARKYNVGMVLAHQYLGQLEGKLQEAFEANTSIKMAGGVSARDARALANQLSCEPELIQRQPKGTFVTFVRGLTERGIPISFPFFALEKMPQRDRDEIEAIRAESRTRYAEPVKQAKADDVAEEQEPDEPSGAAPRDRDGSKGSSQRSDDDGTAASDTW